MPNQIFLITFYTYKYPTPNHIFPSSSPTLPPKKKKKKENKPKVNMVCIGLKRNFFYGISLERGLYRCSHLDGRLLFKYRSFVES
ncbi:hypothetical protein HanRHA438_Chr11g0514081 [Helianthus annuus]|uniref:Uncharacterized protein n=1 Tax=Helianthus annuus TaxID=4232 RepID=A0A251SJ82_HELAN|nr:hypothetical protein HanXRQr2_Chr11g0501391 [Helianthus annuus]KAJ0502317.1 hypothetical protein HanHA300_Chr11g0411541 [Helianthus annuus]KAJ0510354.1 hypothetical protein HanIR_Chr11g0539871 [Helianthus annuus]KAJ0518239.1 hypothetical protein HanHA89_Chr11g0435211 [Helianthus annuus]KAJ0686271.1 hypothetical protein HanLR1_Chr11g0412871 [Helianthus annuus]